MDLCEIHQIGSGTVELLLHPEQCAALRGCGILRAGISSATQHFHFSRISPDEAQVLVCLGGMGRVRVDGVDRRCRVGEAYLTPPHRPHAYRAERRWQVAWIAYAPGSEAARKIKDPCLVSIDPRPFEYVIRGLHQEVATRHSPSLTEAWVFLLQAQVLRILEPDQSSRLWKLWQKVEATLGNPWTLPQLAREGGLSEEQLRRICLKETGESPMRHLTCLRMRHAVSLLSAGAKVGAAAHALGYENAYAFSTAFKRHMGRTPSDFKPSHAANGGSW